MKINHKRQCHFCKFKADYDEFPDGSIVYLGICACADCLEKDSTKDFKEVTEKDVKE